MPPAKIESVPLPKLREPNKIPYEDMKKVEDSFFLPGGKLQTVCNSNNSASKKYGGKFIARTWIEEGVKGVRVWRAS